ncbi:MAG TPA: SDR family NAD(P)-dependent oxidoreductase [Gemmatimonadales bacterium]
MKPLAGKVAVVAGATRGAGRGIARMLGEAGAIVYCTGRSSRTAPNTSSHHYAGRPETIEETAELVDAAGGEGIPVRVDHGNEKDVAALFRSVKRRSKRLDVLANVLTGRPVTAWGPFWKADVADGLDQLTGWLGPHALTLRHAAPLMIAGRSGLIVEIVEQHTLGHHGQLWLDAFEIALKRLAYAAAEELAPHNVAAVALTPGFMRTEAILEQFGVTEENWRDAVNEPVPRGFGWAGSETPCFLGRAVAALAADPEIMRKSGGLYSTWELSELYGFTDVNGERPHLWCYWEKEFPHLTSGRPATGRTWEVRTA